MKSKLFSRVTIPAAVIAAVFVLTGCSDGGGNKKEAEGPERPLQKYESALWDIDEKDRAQLIALQTKAEDLVSSCMAKEGFEYKPNLPPVETPTSSPAPGEEEGPEWGSVEYAETYGYSVIDSPGSENSENTGGEGEDYDDPNEKYRSSLSESEQQAYQATLYGPPEQYDEQMSEGETEMPEYDWTKSGCTGLAQHEVLGDIGSAYEDPEFKELMTQMNEVSNEVYGGGENLPANAEMVKLDKSWSECMADAGFDYPSPAKSQETMENEWFERADSEGNYKEPSKEEKEQYKKKEIKTAVADAKCRKKLNYEKEQQKISNNLEQKFVDEHKEQLDAMVATYGTKAILERIAKEKD